MKYRIILTLYIIIIMPNIIFAQDVPFVPLSRLVDWSNAGLLPGSIQEADNIVSIADYSGSDYQKFMSAISAANNLPGATLIYIPAGTYTINQTINLSNVKTSGIIFQGEGSANTEIVFDGLSSGADCFQIFGTEASIEMDVTENINKGNSIIYGNFTNLNAGDWILLCESDLDDKYLQNGYIGQVSQLVSGGSSSIVMKDQASKSYLISNNLWVKEISPIKNIGFENFKISRTNTTKGYGVNFHFNKAINCWVKGIESYMCTGYHFAVDQCSHIKIHGCYIHHATNYDDDPKGTGYGISVAWSTTNSLIENNIFKKLRHAMIIGAGANCNVFAYNYSREQTWNYFYTGPDICLHGRYPYADLFEENWVDFIMADPSHGLNGPYNTFLRNKTNDVQHICIFNASTNNVIGNSNAIEVLCQPGWVVGKIYEWLEQFEIYPSEDVIDLYFNYYPGFPDPYWQNVWYYLTHGYWYYWKDDAQGYNEYYPRSFLSDISYFYTSRPYFLNLNYSWPSIGSRTNLDYDGFIEDINEGIPSKDRYNDNVKTINANPTEPSIFIYVPSDYPTISSALANSIYGQTINVTGSQSLSSNLSVPSGITLSIKSGATVNLGSYSIISSGGTITIESGGTINSSNSHVRLVTGSTINRLCPTIASAASAVSSGQTIEIYGPHTLTTNYSIPSVVSLSIKSGATLTLGSYSIVSSGGTITVASGATLSPDAKRVSGSTILGLYPSISSALSAASGSQIVEYRGSHTMSSNLTVASGKTLTAKAGSTLSIGSGYYLSVSGTLNASGTSASRAIFTRSGTSGAWGGIRYQRGSIGTIQYANINNATYGVYANSSNPTISNSTISNCSYGVYSYYGSLTLNNNTISSCTYGVYFNHDGNANICTNAITGCTRGVYGYYADYTDIVNNLITSGASSRVAGVQFYDTDEPNLYNNTIESSFTYGLDADHYSRPMAIGPGSQNYQGYNRIIGGGTAMV